MNKTNRTSKPSEQYWKDRQQAERERLLDATDADINKQLVKEYKRLIEYTYKEMRSLVLEIREKGADNVLASHLYQYDKYYELINDLNKKLTALGQSEIDILTKDLTYLHDRNQAIVGKQLGIETNVSVTNSTSTVDSIWAGDKENYSDRLWRDKRLLMNTLQAKLIDCCAGGWSMNEFKRQLMQSFNQTYFNAHRIAVTEASYVYNKSAMDKYQSAGIEYYQILAEPDACPECKKLEGKLIPITEQVLPRHPLCRCSCIAVINKKINP